MNRRVSNAGLLFLTFLLLFPLSVPADLVDDILRENEPPAGVVFEVVEGDPQDLDWVMPQINADVERLRARFPDISIAVVSHGREEFGLTKKKAATMPQVHSLVKDLSEKRDVMIHVCATHASWHDVAPEEFPAYVTVSETGPALINDYVEMGYRKVMVTRYK